VGGIGFVEGNDCSTDTRAMAATSGSDEHAVQRLVDELAAAWAAGDAQAYARLFTEDASYITRFGANLAGPAAIDAAHSPLFAGPMRDSHLTWRAAPDIRLIRPDVAIIVGEGAVATPRGLEPASTITLVAVRDEGLWRFTSFQNTRQAPFPADAPPT
jgi:uncharacterized protein (TIGR02246 family)